MHARVAATISSTGDGRRVIRSELARPAPASFAICDQHPCFERFSYAAVLQPEHSWYGSVGSPASSSPAAAHYQTVSLAGGWYDRLPLRRSCPHTQSDRRRFTPGYSAWPSPAHRAPHRLLSMSLHREETDERRELTIANCKVRHAACPLPT